MKKLLVLSVIVLTTIFQSFAQKPFPIPNKEVRQWAAGDTLSVKLEGDSVKIITTKDFISFNKDLTVNGDSLTKLSRVKELVADSLGDFYTKSETRTVVSDSVSIVRDSLSYYSLTTGVQGFINDSIDVVRDSIAILRDSVDVLRGNFSNYTTTVNMTDSLDTRLAPYIDSTTVLARINDSITTNLADYSITQDIKDLINDSLNLAVRLTGDQTISGVKTFNHDIAVNGRIKVDTIWTAGSLVTFTDSMKITKSLEVGDTLTSPNIKATNYYIGNYPVLVDNGTGTYIMKGYQGASDLMSIDNGTTLIYGGNGGYEWLGEDANAAYMNSLGGNRMIEGALTGLQLFDEQGNTIINISRDDSTTLILSAFNGADAIRIDSTVSIYNPKTSARAIHIDNTGVTVDDNLKTTNKFIGDSLYTTTNQPLLTATPITTTISRGDTTFIVNKKDSLKLMQPVYSTYSVLVGSDTLLTKTRVNEIISDSIAGITSTPANYIMAYDTTTQVVAVANTWYDLLYSHNQNINGWTHTAGTASFTCPKTALYEVTCNTTYERTASTSPNRMGVRALFNGVEVAGSGIAGTSGASLYPQVLTCTFFVSGTSGQVLKMQYEGSHVGMQIVNAAVNATKNISCQITIKELK